MLLWLGFSMDLRSGVIICHLDWTYFFEKDDVIVWFVCYIRSVLWFDFIYFKLYWKCAVHCGQFACLRRCFTLLTLVFVQRKIRTKLRTVELMRDENKYTHFDWPKAIRCKPAYAAMDNFPDYFPLLILKI